MAKASLEKGHEVTLINRGNRPYRVLSNAFYLKADIYDIKAIKSLLEGKLFDIIIDPLVYDGSTLNRNLATFSSYCKKYVIISSCCAFGCSADNEAIDETCDMKPESKYGIGKKECEDILKSYGIIYTIIRPYITYGDIRLPIPFSCRENPYTVINRIREEKPLVCFEYTFHSTFHNLMYIDDFSNIAISALESSSSDNNDFNICSRHFYTWEETYASLYQCLNKEKHVYQISREYFKRFDSHLYEDMLYDKDHYGAVYCGEKVRNITGINSDEVPLLDGIRMSITYLDSHMQRLPLETAYDIQTDALLLFAVKEKDAFLKDYIKSMTVQYKVWLCLIWIWAPLKKLLKKTKAILKTMPH